MVGTKQSQIIFVDGKEKSLDGLFIGLGENPAPVFGYLALGYNDTDDNGFIDPGISGDDATSETDYGGFKELEYGTTYYERIPLEASSEDVIKDQTTGKILKKYEATVPTDVITSSSINQFAICDEKTVGDVNTTFYCASTFPTFTKTDEVSLTFVIGFKI